MPDNKILPCFEKIEEAESYAKSLKTEFRACIEEGLDIKQYEDLFGAVTNMPDSEEKEKIADIIFGIVSSAGTVAGYKYTEPSDLEGIKALRKPCPLPAGLPDRETLKNKLSGAWYGRICGCLLGKTVEGFRTDSLVPFLKLSGNYPMHRYIYSSDLTDDMKSGKDRLFSGRCFADSVKRAPVDDDTNYTMLAQKLIDDCGRDFTPEDVARIWINTQGKYSYFTAERIAFMNYINGFKPPFTATYKNPFREWIGAQIRGDYYGYINPGNPEKAAEMAHRDACISHTRNGIYGEMFISAMLACAAVNDDITGVIRGGLAQIPASSRLYEAIDGVINGYSGGVSREECFAEIHTLYDEHDSADWCHTVSNAMIVAAALLYGEGDYGKTVCMAVETGFDTDCNAATAGSITGMMKGMGAIDKCWTDAVHGQLDTSIFGVGTVNISDLIDKTMKHIEMR